MTRLELETSALPRRRSTDWATSAIQMYKPDKKHFTMTPYVCQRNFTEFFKKYKQLKTSNYKNPFAQNKWCVIMTKCAEMYLWSLSCTCFCGWFSASCTLISSTYAPRTPQKFGHNWQKIFSQNQAQKDSKSTLKRKGGLYVF